MSNPLNINKWAIGDKENAYYCPIPYGPSGASSLRLYIPTLMPLIGGPSLPIKTVKSISSSCFLNDPTCKPSIAKKLTTQNYITVKCYPNREFKKGFFRHGAELVVEVINNDPHNLAVTNKVDNSVNI